MLVCVCLSVCPSLSLSSSLSLPLYLSPVRSLSVESYTLYPMLFNSNVQGFNPEHIFITRWRETPPPRTLVWSGEAIDWSQRVNICCLATKHRSPCQLMLKSIQFSTERAPIDVSVIEHALFYRWHFVVVIDVSTQIVCVQIYFYGYWNHPWPQITLDSGSFCCDCSPFRYHFLNEMATCCGNMYQDYISQPPVQRYFSVKKRPQFM